VGIPFLVPQFVPPGMDILFHSENGILGYGRALAEGEEVDPTLINASGQYVTLRPGASFFDSAQSFAMVRGGHLDATVLGALQVSERGDLANWLLPHRRIGGVGGAMDLVAGARRVIVAMQHTDPAGRPQIVRRCRYPLTGVRCVHRIVTNLAVIDVTPSGLVLREVAPGVSPDDVQEATEARLIINPPVPEMTL